MCYSTVYVSSRTALTVLNIVGKGHSHELCRDIPHGGAQWRDGRSPDVHVRRWQLAPYIGDPMVRFKYFQIFFQ